MKHLSSTEAELLRDSLAGLGVSLPAADQALLLRYLDEILEINQRINLTSIVDPTSAVVLHLVDSLCALEEVTAAPEGELLDIGTGGGFPGLPLGVASARKTLLLDSVAKKARAVEEAIEHTRIQLPVRCQAKRAEALAESEPGTFAVVTARAVAPLPSLVELAAPLLVLGGRLVCLKGTPSSEEANSGDEAARVCGLERSSARAFTLPADRGERTIIVYERVGEPKISLPRRVGLAQSTPLA